MQIVATGNVTFLLLSGVSVTINLRLSDHVELQSADTSHLDLQTALSTCSHPDDIAVVAAFIPRTTAQFRIAAASPKELAIVAWNASWDALLLGALLHTEIGFNLQSDTPANMIAADSPLRATNLYMHALTNDLPHILTADEAEWLIAHFANARRLLDNDRFQTAVHCLATCRWHSMPRIRLAILWAGIEGLFGASSEIRFRISLYIARYLHPDDASARRALFDSVQKLYNARSAAVHGSNIKGDSALAVTDSAEVLCNLLRRCATVGSIPDVNDLAP
jgi:hypothetical protein